ncbi:hypothetical protein ANRL3_00928 [Anaerolineae bacterium]|nr:hypothetical protein ANRL3_00928 [Anaerolineae bacterium]
MTNNDNTDVAAGASANINTSISSASTPIKRLRAVIYVRVSTDEQAEQGRSLDKQLDYCRLYCQQHNLEIVGEYADDYTGTVPLEQRPKGSLVYKMLADNVADVLVVFMMDRLVRPPEEGDEWDIAILVRGLAKLKKEIHRTDRGRIGTSFADLLIAVIDAKSAGDERRVAVKRMTIGRYQKARAGLVVGGKFAPFGYRFLRDDHGRVYGMEICEEEADVVRKIYIWYTKERLTMWAIAKRLNLTHVTIPWYRQTRARKANKNSPPKLWSVRTVHRILANETYKGDWAYGKYGTDYSTRRILANGNEYGGKRIQNPRSQWVHVSVPAIIDSKIWKEAESLRTANRKMSSRNGKSPYPLRGRIKCAYCGRILNGQTIKHPYGIFRYYGCPKHRNKAMGDSCPQASLSADFLEKEIWNYLRRLMEDKKRFERTLRRCLSKTDKTIADKKRELELVQEEVRDAEEAIEGLGRLASKARGKALEALEAQIELATDRHEHAIAKEEHIANQLKGLDVMPNVETALQFRSDVMRGLQDPSPTNMQYAFNLMQVQVIAHDKKCQVFCMIPGDPGVVDFTKGIELATRIEFPPSRNVPSRISPRVSVSPSPSPMTTVRLPRSCRTCSSA